jgi:hypothetical protein
LVAVETVGFASHHLRRAAMCPGFHGVLVRIIRIKRVEQDRGKIHTSVLWLLEQFGLELFYG